jgi:hypothetical protein
MIPKIESEAKKWATFVIKSWMMEHDAKRIIICAVCLGMPMTRDDVNIIIKGYIDSQSENKTYGKKK